MCPSSKPASHAPHAADRHIPPRKPDGVVSGSLKSGWASSHSTHASGRSRATAGSVVMQIEQSEEVSTGKRPAASASSTWPPASSRQPRASRRSSS